MDNRQTQPRTQTRPRPTRFPWRAAVYLTAGEGAPRPDGGAMNSDERAHPSGAKGAYRAMVEFATASSLVRTSERGSSGADVPSPSPIAAASCLNLSAKVCDVGLLPGGSRRSC